MKCTSIYHTYIVKRTTRKTAFYDAQSMTRADKEHAFERALKIDVNFPKYEESRTCIYVCPKIGVQQKKLKTRRAPTIKKCDV